MSVQSFENTRWMNKAQSAQFRHRAALAFITKGPVLDVGCGDGLFLSLCKQKGIDAQGVDFSSVAVANCREQGHTAEQVDITAGPLPFPRKAFPTVVALDVLEHIYDPEALVVEMKRISSDEIIMGVPNFSSLPARVQTFFGSVPENNRPGKGHVYWFNWKIFQSLIEKNNLRIVGWRVNAPWERVPVIGRVTHLLARLFPNLFALSFVVACTQP